MKFKWKFESSILKLDCKNVCHAIITAIKMDSLKYLTIFLRFSTWVPNISNFFLVFFICTSTWPKSTEFDLDINMSSTYWYNFYCPLTSVTCAVGPSVTRSTTDFSFQNLVFWNLFEFSVAKII